MTPSLEGWPTKAKEAPSPHKVRLALLDTKPVFQSLGGNNLFCENPVFEQLLYNFWVYAKRIFFCDEVSIRGLVNDKEGLLKCWSHNLMKINYQKVFWDLGWKH